MKKKYAYIISFLCVIILAVIFFLLKNDSNQDNIVDLYVPPSFVYYPVRIATLNDAVSSIGEAIAFDNQYIKEIYINKDNSIIIKKGEYFKKGETLFRDNSNNKQADFNGKLIDIITEKNKIIMRCLNLDKLHIQTYISELDAQQINYNSKTNLLYNDQKIEGKIKQIDYKVEDGKVRLVINANINCLLGSSVELEIIKNTKPNVVVIENICLQQRTNGSYFVYLLNGDNDYIEKDIEVGISDGECSEIIKGLKEGDMVVTMKEN